MLILTAILSRDIHGAKRFLELPGLGLTFQTSERTYKEDDSQGDDTDHKVLLDGQVSYFGIEAGTKLCGFAELGGGQQGILLGGLRYKF